jgi:creatinine amidohydrolase
MLMTRIAPWLVSSFLLLPASGALGAMPDSVFVDDLTWVELQGRVRAGATTLIVPIGGTEQNGPHMVLGKHNVRVKLLSEKIAKSLGNALVAPVIAYVPEGGVAPPTAHMRFPGTITVPEAAFERILEYAARSFRLHGFRDVVFLGDHGGYRKSLNAVADRLNREWVATSVRVHAVDEYYQAAEIAYPKALKSRGYRDDEIGTHAGLADTSLAMAVDPRLVRTDRLQAGEALGRAEGVYGDPRRSSAELGQTAVDAIVTESVNAIKRAVVRK